MLPIRFLSPKNAMRINRIAYNQEGNGMKKKDIQLPGNKKM